LSLATTTVEPLAALRCCCGHSIIGQIQIVIVLAFHLRNHPQLLLTIPPSPLSLRLRPGIRGNLRGLPNMGQHTRAKSTQSKILTVVQEYGTITDLQQARRSQSIKYGVFHHLTAVENKKDTYPCLHRPCIAARTPLSHCRLVLALGEHLHQLPLWCFS
jgi:hypothetical protein